MKKTLKKLELRTEVIRNLRSLQLSRVVGAKPRESVNFPCATWEDCTWWQTCTIPPTETCTCTQTFD